MTLCVGVDGCPSGWIAVSAASDLTGATAAWRPTLAAAFAAAPEAMFVIDMPVGLAEDGKGRAADGEARSRLGPRRSSVFAPPCRAALDAPDYPSANAAQRRQTGKGLSKQAWMLAPKLREIEAAITPAMQERVREGHPELGFREAAGAHLSQSKRRLHGQFERMRILARLGFDVPALAAGLPPDLDAAPDDLLDACILAHVAARCARGEAIRLPASPRRDARGLLMEIWA